MIDFNHIDYNLTKIGHQSKLHTLVTTRPYRIYGLRQEDNPLVKLEYNGNIINLEAKMQVLHKFFKQNNISFEHSHKKYTGQSISISLRRDLREFVSLSGAILQTIILYIEGRTEIPDNYSVPGIPKML